MARPKRKSNQLDPTRRQRYRRLVDEGWQYVTQGRLEDAEARFRAATQLAPQRGEAWYGLGVTRYHQDDVPAAYDALRRAVALSPGLAEAWLTLAQVADKLGYTLEAYDAAEEALRLARAQDYAAQVLEGFAAVARALRQALERLAAELGIALETEEDEARLRRAYRHFQAGVEAAQRGDFAAAAAAFRQAVEAGANSPRTWSNLGAALLMAGDLDNAEAAFRKALELKPEYVPAQRNLQLLSKMRENPELEVSTFLHGYTDLKFNAPKRKRLK